MRAATRVSFVALLCVLALVAPAAAAVAPVAPQAAPSAGSAPVPSVTYDMPENGTDGGNATQRVFPGDSSETDAPPLAGQVRVTPVRFDEKYSKVEIREQDSVYGVSGEFVVFALSERVEAARIANNEAQAKVQDGGQTVTVRFTPDASVADKESFYRAELFFEDGSKRVIDLYAKNTDVRVVDSQLADADELVGIMLDDAEAHGFERSLDGAIEYHEWERRQADIFDDLFGPELSKFLGALIAMLSSAFMLLFLAAVIVLALWRFLKTHGWKIRSHMNTPDLVETKRREIELQYHNQQHAADEEPLEDIPEIGRDHIYWEDMGVSSVKALADLFAFGEPKTTPGGELVRDESADPLKAADGTTLTHPDGKTPVYPVVMEHRGVEDLWQAMQEGRSLRDTWLEPMLRVDMLGSEQSALAHAKRALLRMSTKYGQPQYGESRAQTARMLEEISDGPDTDGNRSSMAGVSTGFSSRHDRGETAPGDD